MYHCHSAEVPINNSSLQSASTVHGYASVRTLSGQSCRAVPGFLGCYGPPAARFCDDPGRDSPSVLRLLRFLSGRIHKGYDVLLCTAAGNRYLGAHRDSRFLSECIKYSFYASFSSFFSPASEMPCPNNQCSPKFTTFSAQASHPCSGSGNSFRISFMTLSGSPDFRISVIRSPSWITSSVISCMTGSSG